MEWKAILFDLDNTLLDRTSSFAGFTRDFIRIFLPHSTDDSKVLGTIIEMDQDGYKAKRELFAELLEVLPWKDKPELDELMSFYQREYVNNAVLMPRALHVLNHTKPKYKLGLITNGKTSIQYGKIDKLELRPLFDSIIVSEEAGVKKPSPDIFQMAVKQLGVRAEECLFIGDHPVNDIEGAALTGMNTIWMKVNQPWPDHLHVIPLHTIHKLEELLDIL